MKRISIILFFSLLFISCISIKNKEQKGEVPVLKEHKYEVEVHFKSSHPHELNLSTSPDKVLKDYPYIVEDLINKKTYKYYENSPSKDLILEDVKEFHLKITQTTDFLFSYHSHIIFDGHKDPTEDSVLHLKYWKDGKLEKDEVLKGEDAASVSFIAEREDL